MKHLIIIGLVLVAVLVSGCTDLGEYGRQKNITVVDKTAEVVRSGFGAQTDYKVLADDGTVYHTTWEGYRTLEVNGTYLIQAHNRNSAGLAAPYWRITLIVVEE